MALLNEKQFSFISNAPGLTEDTFAVVSFRGFEGISKPYEFDILLVSENPEIDLDQMTQKPARLVIHREDGRDVRYQGILQQFEQLHEAKGVVFYRALLSPRLWWLSLTHHHQVCLGESVSAIVENTLLDGGLSAFDFEFRLQGTYPEMEYVCQYGESHLNFVSRRLEREGIYYFFEQTDAGEKVVFTDTKISHTDLALEKDLFYSPPSGLDNAHRGEIIQSFTCRQRQLPRTVLLRDYNYEKPSLEISGSAEVDPNGRGEAYLYGEYFPTPEEGNRLAAIRAEELLCRRQEFFGESTVPFLMTGFTFTLNDYYRSGFNRKYLITEVTHEGNQTGYLTSGLSEALSERESRVFYRNSFSAIPSDVQFRPERKTERPRIAGTMNARIDAEGSGTYAELDDQGRYKVRLPFDVNDAHGAGKASSYVRMAQPYAGSDHGMHFPLHKGTEVLLTFIDGNPDRPIIAGALPNPETPSVVNSANNASGGFSDGSNNFIMHNSNAGQRITMIAGPEGGSAFFSMGTGSPSGAQSQSDYESRNSNFFTNAGVFSSAVGALSQNLTSQSVLWAFMRLFSKHISDTITEHDKIGRKTGDIDSDSHYGGLSEFQMALIVVAPLVFSMILTSQMSFSLAKHLLKKAKVLPMANFGKDAMELHLKLMTNSGWIARIREAVAGGILDTLSNALSGWSGTYGVMVFNNTNSMLGGLLNPTSGSGVKLNPRKPDILIASGYGYIDIDAGKDFTVNAANDIVLDAKNIIIDAPEKVMIGGGSIGKATVTISQKNFMSSAVVIESGCASISVAGMNEMLSPSIELVAQRYPFLPLKQSVILDDKSVTIGNKLTSGTVAIDNMGIKLDTLTEISASAKLNLKLSALAKAKISGALGVTVDSTAGDAILTGMTGVKVGTIFTPQTKIAGSMLQLQGDMVTIKGTGIVKTTGAMIQIG